MNRTWENGSVPTVACERPITPTAGPDLDIWPPCSSEGTLALAARPRPEHSHCAVRQDRTINHDDW